MQYLGYVQKLGLSLVNVLAFVLQLGYCSFGTDYPCDNSNNEIGRVIQHFREMGLIFKRKSKEQVVFKKCSPETKFYRGSIQRAWRSQSVLLAAKRHRQKMFKSSLFSSRPITEFMLIQIPSCIMRLFPSLLKFNTGTTHRT